MFRKYNIFPLTRLVYKFSVAIDLCVIVIGFYYAIIQLVLAFGKKLLDEIYVSAHLTCARIEYTFKKYYREI